MEWETTPESQKWYEEEFSEVDFGDKRLNRRVIKIAQKFSEFPEYPINQACQDWQDVKAAYRFFQNEDVTAQAILHPHQMRTLQRASGEKVILAIQDTSYFNYTSHEKTSGLGKITSCANGDLRFPNNGFIMHTTFGVSTEGLPLGILSQELWARSAEEKKPTIDLPIEEKESFKWLKALRQSRDRFVESGEDLQMVTVCDREADIYELFVEADRSKMPFLVRASADRLINKKSRRSKPKAKLWPYMSSQKSAGFMKVLVPKKKGQPSREALLEIKYAPFILNAPHNKTVRKNGELPNLSLYAVYVSEVNPPSEKVALEWMLLTNLKVNTLEEAIEKVRWYCFRWRIESFHKILKTGCAVEACRLETADRLIRYLTLKSITAWRIFWLTLVGRSRPDDPCTSVLTEREWKIIYCKIKKTKSLPSQPPPLQQAIRWIAQLGGFLARKGDGDPGMITLWRGWQRLTDLVEGSVITETYG